MNKLLALADRVEKLTGPDREVDCLIAVAVNEGSLPGAVKSISDVPEVMASGYVRHTYNGSSSYQQVLSYTSSIDAAMTLVPKGWGWQLSETGVAGAWLVSDGEQPITVDGLTFPGVTAQVGAKAISPALALTCSALRARAHGGGER